MSVNSQSNESARNEQDVDAGYHKPTQAMELLDWGDEQRALLKTQAATYLYKRGHGMPVVEVVKAVSGENPSDADRKLIRRFFSRHDQFNLVVWEDTARFKYYVEPLTLKSHLEGSITHSNRSPESLYGEFRNLDFQSLEETRERTEYARDRVQDKLESQNGIHGEGEMRYLVQELELDAVTRKEQMALRREQDGEFTLADCLHTFYTSPERARSKWGRFVNKLEVAGEKHHRGCMVTLTTDPGNFDSIIEQASTLRGDMEAFLKKVKRDTGRENLDYVSKMEFTDKGRPHLHVVIFGITSAFMPELEEIQDFMGERERGEEVEYTPVRWCDRDQEWKLHGSSDAALRNYLFDGFREALAVAKDEISITQMIHGDLDLWKLALHWGCDAMMWSASTGLGRERPVYPRYKLPDMIGAVSSLDEIPATIRQNLTNPGDLVGRDRPPGEAGAVTGRE